MTGQNNKAKKVSIPAPGNDKLAYVKWLFLSCVLLITFICFSYAIKNQFTSWDDDTYITQNSYITNFSAANIKSLFTKEFVANWQPLTMLSYSFNYSLSKLDPGSYFFTNVILHLLNVCLVFIIVLRLSEKMMRLGYSGIQSNKYWFPALFALWYGIHPMHVESVAWASERKDLLYALFYFLAIVCYMQYAENKKAKWMIYVFVCFILSCMSKQMAVVLPLSLLLIDILLKRKLEWKLLKEKIPLFLLSLIMGILAYFIQAHSGAVTSFHALTLSERVMFPAYGFTMYCLKAIMPVALSSYYPYPDLSGVPLPFIFHIAPFLAIAIISIPLYLCYRAGENFFRIAVFGFGFYLVNLLFVLQFISVGKTIMADRYSYVSYFGLIFIVLYFAFALMNWKTSCRFPVKILLASSSIVFVILTFNRVRVWHNAETLWRDVTIKYPLRVGEAYESLANYYYINGKMDSAYNNYKILSGIYFKDPYVFSRVGDISASRQNYAEAITAYSRSLQLDSNYYESYVGRAGSYARLGKFDLAIRDYNRAEKFNPGNVKLIMNRGTSELNSGNINAALSDFMHVLRIDSTNSTCMFVISLAYQKARDYNSALKYALKAKHSGYQIPGEYISKLEQNRTAKNK